MQYTIEYVGDYDGAYKLVEELREAGISVEWTPPDRDRGSVIEDLVLSILASGAYDAIKAISGGVVERLAGRRVHIDPAAERPHGAESGRQQDTRP